MVCGNRVERVVVAAHGGAIVLRGEARRGDAGKTALSTLRWGGTALTHSTLFGSRYVNLARRVIT
jgi:hypothetical protein